ncbi:MAG: hypothetical protein WKF59_19185 [Chitinophagaceae bacterium]
MNTYHSYKNYLAALLAGCFFIVGCENSEQAIKDLTSRRIGVEEGKEISINYSVGGRTRAVLTAPSMLRYQDTVPYTEFPKSIHADFYDATLQYRKQTGCTIW